MYESIKKDSYVNLHFVSLEPSGGYFTSLGCLQIMSEDLIFAGCGILCNDCEFYSGEKAPQCPGCFQSDGAPFWGQCQLYKCNKQKSVDHCGICTDFPCEKFIDQFDPNNPEGQKDAVFRAGILAYRTKHGDKKAVDLLRKVQTLDS